MTGTEDRTKDSGQDRDRTGTGQDGDKGLRDKARDKDKARDRTEDVTEDVAEVAHRHKKAPQGLTYGAMFTV